MLGVMLALPLSVALGITGGIFSQLLIDWDRGRLSILEIWTLFSTGFLFLFLIAEIVYVLSVTP